MFRHFSITFLLGRWETYSKTNVFLSCFPPPPRYEGEEIADGVNTNITVRIGSNGLELQVSKVLRTKIPRDVKLYVLECESTTDFADTAASRKQYKQVVVYCK